jgi:hypothetical protein
MKGSMHVSSVLHIGSCLRWTKRFRPSEGSFANQLYSDPKVNQAVVDWSS